MGPQELIAKITEACTAQYPSNFFEDVGVDVGVLYHLFDNISPHEKAEVIRKVAIIDDVRDQCRHAWILSALCLRAHKGRGDITEGDRYITSMAWSSAIGGSHYLPSPKLWCDLADHIAPPALLEAPNPLVKAVERLSVLEYSRD